MNSPAPRSPRADAAARLPLVALAALSSLLVPVLAQLVGPGLGSLLAPWPLAAAHAQEEAPPPPTILASGVASLEVDARRIPLAYSLTPEGPLFGLDAVVAALGGRLEVGPLGQSQVLVLERSRAIFGPASPSLVVGDQIVSLSPAPLPGAGGIQVPLVLLERTYGDVLGWQFRWDSAALTLVAERRPVSALSVAVEVVHLQGVTTLVLRFPSEIYYQVSRGPGTVVVETAGNRLLAPDPPPLPPDALVQGFRIEGQAIRIDLAPGAQAEDYSLRDPFRIVFDVHRLEDQRAGLFPEPTPPEVDPGLPTIVLDPGHGGAETGAIGPSGAAEKDLALVLARALKARLEERLAVRVVLTREGDEQLPLTTRTALANQYKAHLFISLHLNSSLGRRANGAETYFLSLQASDERAAEVAAAENLEMEVEADAAGDTLADLRLLLWDLAQSHHLAESQRLANLIQEELNQALRLKDRGVKQAPFAVLRGAAMPAVLVELGFLSNPDEEAKLQTPDYRADLVEALARAVARFTASAPAELPREAGP